MKKMILHHEKENMDFIRKEIEEYFSLCYKEKVPFSVLYRKYEKQSQKKEREHLLFFLEKELMSIDRMSLKAIIYFKEKILEVSFEVLEEMNKNPSEYSLFLRFK